MTYRIYIFLVLFGTVFLSCSDAPKTSSGTNNEEVEVTAEASDPLTTLNNQIISDSTNADLYVERAKFYLQTDRIDRALRDVNQALSLNNKQLDAYLVLADIYYGMGQAESVLETLNKATELAPDDPRPQVKLAELHLLQRKLNLALGYTDKALALESNNPEAYYVRGMVFLAREDTVSAMKNFMIARDQDESFFEALYQIGLIYTEQKNPLAVDFLEDAIYRFPNTVVARYQLALYEQEVGSIENAIAHYDTLLMMQPDNSRFIFNLGYIHLVYLQQYEQAISYFDAALAIDPDYIDALYNKGRTLEEMEQYATAREIYEQVLEKQTNYPLAIDGLNRLDRRK